MARQRATLAMLAFAVLGFSIGQTAFIPAVAGAARSLDVSTAAAGWVVTASLVSSAVLTPVLGRLGDIFGRRRLFVLILAAVCIGSILSAIATNLPGIVIGRVLYGAGAGLFPVGFGILRDVLAADRRGQAIGFLSALAGLGGGVGPAVGGLLVELGSYTTIFWVGAVVALVPAVVAPFLLRRRSDRRREPVDWRGVLLLAVGLTAPLVAITNSVRWGWLDLRTGGLALGGLAVLEVWTLVRFERRTVSPLLDMRIVLQQRVAFANAASVLVGYASYSGFVLIALLAQVPVGGGLRARARAGGLRPADGSGVHCDGLNGGTERAHPASRTGAHGALNRRGRVCPRARPDRPESREPGGCRDRRGAPPRRRRPCDRQHVEPRHRCSAERPDR